MLWKKDDEVPKGKCNVCGDKSPMCSCQLAQYASSSDSDIDINDMDLDVLRLLYMAEYEEDDNVSQAYLNKSFDVDSGATSSSPRNSEGKTRTHSYALSRFFSFQLNLFCFFRLYSENYSEN